MPKKKADPAIAVLHYFQEAPLLAAQLALSLAADTVQQRLLESGEIKPKRSHHKQRGEAHESQPVRPV